MLASDGSIAPIISIDDFTAYESDISVGPKVHLVDVRWYLDGRSGRAAYENGHLPGAIFLDLDEVLAELASVDDGRHPLATPERFATGLGQLGIATGDVVVAYDDLGGMVASRLVWMLRILDQPAALLNGGLMAWNSQFGLDLETTINNNEAVERAPMPWPSTATASADEVEEHIANGGTVVDSRSANRYRGENEPVDARAGHIPGAVNAPFGGNLTTGGLFLSRKHLTERFAELRVDENTIFYCGSGVSACHNVLAVESIGLDRPKLYVGSWSQWAADQSRAIAPQPS